MSGLAQFILALLLCLFSQSAFIGPAIVVQEFALPKANGHFQQMDAMRMLALPTSLSSDGSVNLTHSHSLCCLGAYTSLLSTVYLPDAPGS